MLYSDGASVFYILMEQQCVFYSDGALVFYILMKQQ